MGGRARPHFTVSWHHVLLSTCRHATAWGVRSHAVQYLPRGCFPSKWVQAHASTAVPAAMQVLQALEHLPQVVLRTDVQEGRMMQVAGRPSPGMYFPRQRQRMNKQAGQQEICMCHVYHTIHACTST